MAPQENRTSFAIALAAAFALLIGAAGASGCSSDRPTDANGGDNGGDNGGPGEVDADLGESPCPCDGDASCAGGGSDEYCEVPQGGDCGDADYQCAAGLSCEGSTCVGDDGASCDNRDDCSGDLDCVEGSCAESHCEEDLTCPEDGDSETREQTFCAQSGEGCVECRYWRSDAHDDCPGDDVCVDDFGFCAQPYVVPREEPIEDSLAEEEALAIAATQCYLDTEDLTTDITGRTRNAFCGTVVMEDADKGLSLDDIRPRADDDEFDYLASEGQIDGYDAQDIADDIPYVWRDRTTRPNRMSWFGESSLEGIASTSRYEICVWMGKRASGPWRIGVDTCEAYMDRGYVDDWDEDGD